MYVDLFICRVDGSGRVASARQRLDRSARGQVRPVKMVIYHK